MKKPLHLDTTVCSAQEFTVSVGMIRVLEMWECKSDHLLVCIDPLQVG